MGHFCAWLRTLSWGLVVASLLLRGGELSLAPSVLCRGCNVILLSMDTLRADHVGAYGYGQPTTPNIDRLAETSVLFENAISQSSWTRPAHLSMLTGLYPAEHGVLQVSDRVGPPPQLPTLASVLSAHGYVSAAFTGGRNMSARFGFDHGFGLYKTVGRNLISKQSLLDKWLAEHRTQRFFVFLHGFDPHRPYHSREVDRAALGLGPRRPHGWKNLCARGQRPKGPVTVIGEYDAAIHQGDRAVGRVLATLDRLGLKDRTIVIVTSDHGEEFLEHGSCFHLRTLYREVLHVPLIVHVPGVERLRISGVVAASVAIGPTTLEMVGIPGRPLPGPSLAPVITGRKAPSGYAVSETKTRLRREPFLSGHVRSITTDRDKLIDWIDRGRREYFELGADPLEQHSLDQHPRAIGLHERLDRWVDQHHRLLERPLPITVPARLDRRLRVLGYVD